MQGSESNRPHPRLMRPGRAQPSLQIDVAAGCRGIEPRWPVLETSPIPDRGPGAPVWNRTSISCASGRRHHQIGFESKIVAGRPKLVIARPRASSTIWLSKIIPAVAGVVAAVHEDFAKRIDVSRSRPGARLPAAWNRHAEMKKAAEVDFTWAAFARTYEKALANRSSR